jgi:hypothetical protein
MFVCMQPCNDEQAERERGVRSRQAVRACVRGVRTWSRQLGIHLQISTLLSACSSATKNVGWKGEKREKEKRDRENPTSLSSWASRIKIHDRVRTDLQTTHARTHARTHGHPHPQSRIQRMRVFTHRHRFAVFGMS